MLYQLAVLRVEDPIVHPRHPARAIRQCGIEQYPGLLEAGGNDDRLGSRLHQGTLDTRQRNPGQEARLAVAPRHGQAGIGNRGSEGPLDKVALPRQHPEGLPSKRTLRHPQACEVSNDALREPSVEYRKSLSLIHI